MKKIIYFLFIFLPLVATSQVGIGTTNPNPSSLLDITDTTKGVLVPRMTQAQRDAITGPATGLLIYQTNNSPGFYYFNGTIWVSLASAGWSTTGNNGTSPSINKVGTIDNQGFSLATNNTEKIRVSNTGNVGIGTNAPSTRLHIVGSSNGLQIVDGFQANGKVLVSNATGQATWQNPTPSNTIDQDWTWNSGSTNTDPIYHVANVFIGSGATTTTRNLQAWNGTATGTIVEVGSVEYLQDGINEIRVSDLFTPLTDASQDLGTTARRWTAVYATNGTIQTSDIRLKEDIQPLNYGLAEILKLRPVSFNWKEEKVDNFIILSSEKETKLGFIAQEVLEIIPEAIVTKDWFIDGEHPEKGLQEIEAERLGISYSEIIPVMIKAIQEQQENIDKIKETNQKLKVLIEKLKLSKAK